MIIKEYKEFKEYYNKREFTFRTLDGLNFEMKTGFSGIVWRPIRNKVTIDNLIKQYNNSIKPKRKVSKKVK